MRIVGGRLRGRRLAAVRGSIRPTSDRLRETLFDVLGNTVEGSSWLDLFAGTGAVGIEAWSRGAASVILNDRHPDAIRLIRRNLEICGLSDRVRVFQQDAFSFLDRPGSGPPASFVFLDPPYDFRRHDKLFRKLRESPATAPEALLILEIFHKTQLELPPAGFHLLRSLASGDSCLLFLRRVGQAGDPEGGQ